MHEPQVLHPLDVTGLRWRGRRWTHFTGSDYLRLSWHPEVRAAVASAVGEWGPSVGASRLTTGNVALYGALERDLARFFGARTATLTSAGYTAPLVAAQALAASHARVLIDERAHACLLDAAGMTGLPIERFPHRDAAGLARSLESGRSAGRALVLTDGIFTHDGSAAPLAEYLAVLPRSRGTLLVDDAHGAAVVGRRGRGTIELAGVPADRVVLTITLSKAFGSYGGAVLGPAAVRRSILEHSRLYRGNTLVPPPLAAGARAAVAVLRREGVARRARLRRNVARLEDGLRGTGLRAGGPPGPIVSLAPDSRAAVTRLTRMLMAEGIYPSRIRYPNGPAPEFFRFALSSEHTQEEVDRLARVLALFGRAKESR